MFTKRVSIDIFDEKSSSYIRSATDVYLKINTDEIMYDADKKRMTNSIGKPDHVYYNGKPYLYVIDEKMGKMHRIDLSSLAEKEIEQALNKTFGSNYKHEIPTSTVFRQIILRGSNKVPPPKPTPLPAPVSVPVMVVDNTPKVTRPIADIVTSIVHVTPADGVIIPSQAAISACKTAVKEPKSVNMEAKLSQTEFPVLRNLELTTAYKPLDQFFSSESLALKNNKITLTEQGVRESLEARYYKDWASIVKPEDLRDASVQNLVLKYEIGELPKFSSTAVATYMDAKNEAVRQYDDAVSKKKSENVAFRSFEERYTRLMNEIKNDMAEARQRIAEEISEKTSSINNSLPYDNNIDRVSFVDSNPRLPASIDDTILAFKVLPAQQQSEALKSLLTQCTSDADKVKIYIALGSLTASYSPQVMSPIPYNQSPMNQFQQPHVMQQQQPMMSSIPSIPVMPSPTKSQQSNNYEDNFMQDPQIPATPMVNDQQVEDDDFVLQ